MHASLTNRTRSLQRGLLVLGACILLLHFTVPVATFCIATLRPSGLTRTLGAAPETKNFAYFLRSSLGVALRLDVLAIYGFLVFLSRATVVRVWKHLVRSEPAAGARDILCAAGLVGLLAGIIEGLISFLRQAVQGLSEATLYHSHDALWLAPVGECLAILAFGVLIVVTTRAWRHPVSWRTVLFLLCTPALYAMVRPLRLGISPGAAWLLSLGAAAQIASAVARRASVFQRRLRLLLAGCIFCVATSAALLHGSRYIREGRLLHKFRAADIGPNVVLIILDTVRPANMSLYGHEHQTTPRLEDLATESLVVDGVIAASSWTLPSHAAILTGRFAAALDVGFTSPMRQGYPTLAEILAQEGYATAAFMSNYMFAGRNAGMARGFMHFQDAPVRLAMVSNNSWLLFHAVSVVRWILHKPNKNTRDAKSIVDAFLRWTERDRNRPYFAVLNLMDAHSPYQSPDSVLFRFVDHRPLSRNSPGVTYTAYQLQDLHAAYDAAIAYIDQEVGRLVDTLRNRGDLDNTVLVVTSDHGEQLGEHAADLTGHGNSLFAALVRVPLLMHAPGRITQAGRIRRTVAAHRIAATILALAVPEDSALLAGLPIVGTDGVFTAPEDDEDIALSFVKPSRANVASEPVFAGPMASAVWQRWHYVRDGVGSEELYDLVLDPWEIEDRAQDSSLVAVRRSLRKAVTALEQHGVPAAASVR